MSMCFDVPNPNEDGSADFSSNLDNVNDDMSSQSTTAINLSHTIADELLGERLDKVASAIFTGFSRSLLQTWINLGDLRVNGAPQKSKYRVKSGDMLTLDTVIESHSDDQPEDIPIDVVYIDDDVIVINKPAGLVVHPGAGNRTGTLVNALLYHYPDNAQLPRAGLVHRIDKDTSGLLVVARTKLAQLALTTQLKDKSVYRHYQCVVMGVPNDILHHKHIELPIARHPRERTKMAVQEGGRDAVTHIVEARALGVYCSLLDVHLKTGRTHQIRVHLSHIGYGLIGDKVYGTPVRAGLPANVRTTIKNFPRQALHAYALGFIHPKTRQQMRFSVPIPDDMRTLITALQDDRGVC